MASEQGTQSKKAAKNNSESSKAVSSNSNEESSITSRDSRSSGEVSSMFDTASIISLLAIGFSLYIWVTISSKISNATDPIEKRISDVEARLDNIEHSIHIYGNKMTNVTTEVARMSSATDDIGEISNALADLTDSYEDVVQVVNDNSSVLSELIIANKDIVIRDRPSVVSNKRSKKGKRNRK